MTRARASWRLAVGALAVVAALGMWIAGSGGEASAPARTPGPTAAAIVRVLSASRGRLDDRQVPCPLGQDVARERVVPGGGRRGGGLGVR